MTTSKNHHYNPRSILRRFIAVKNSIYVLNKENNTIFKNSIDKTGSENYFNTIKLDGHQLNFEILFDKMDGRLAFLTNKIVEEKSLQNLDIQELEDLALVVAVQLIRTKIVRSEAQDLTSKLNRLAKESVIRKNSKVDLYPELDKEQIKISTLINLNNIEEFQTSLREKDILLAECANISKKFLTSDNPVVMGNSLDYGQIGLNEKGIEVYYPIAPNFCIIYYCKSIRNNLALARHHNQFMDNLVSTIENKGTMTYTEKNVNYCNHLQLINSSQFLYSSNNDFVHELAYLSQHPKYQKIESRHGEFTKKPPRLDSLPMGDIIVLHTKKRSFKIQIYDVKSEIDFSFTTDEMYKFELFTNEDELDRMIYYKDKVQQRMMNELKVLSKNESQVTIGLKNRSLADVIKRIKNKTSD